MSSGNSVKMIWNQLVWKVTRVMLTFKVVAVNVNDAFSSLVQTSGHWLVECVAYYVAECHTSIRVHEAEIVDPVYREAKYLIDGSIYCIIVRSNYWKITSKIEQICLPLLLAYQRIR